MCFCCGVFYFSARQAEVRVWAGVVEGACDSCLLPFFTQTRPRPKPLFLSDFFFSFCFPLAPRAAFRGQRAVEAAPLSPLRRSGGAEHHGKDFSRRRPGSPGAGGGGGRGRRRLRGGSERVGRAGEAGPAEAGVGVRLGTGCVVSVCEGDFCVGRLESCRLLVRGVFCDASRASSARGGGEQERSGARE